MSHYPLYNLRVLTTLHIPDILVLFPLFTLLGPFLSPVLNIYKPQPRAGGRAPFPLKHHYSHGDILVRTDTFRRLRSGVWAGVMKP